MYRRWSSSLFSALWLVLIGAMWLAFAPTQAGGQAAYIIVIGKSMEPNFHLGDLIIVQRASNYRIGEIVAYRNRQLNNNVFHRIIGLENSRFIMKGDNNNWVDSYRPSSKEVIGKLWLTIPRGGMLIQKMRTPIVTALIAGILGIILASSLFPETKGRQRMNKKSGQAWFTTIKQKIRNWAVRERNDQSQKLPGNKPSSNWGILTENSVFVLGTLAFLSLILAIIAFYNPVSRVSNNDISYEQLGFFTYSSSAPQGVYDGNSIQSGDPIFPKLTCMIEVGFQYSLVAIQADKIAGSYQMSASIIEPASGWKRTVPLQTETAFSGNLFNTKASLNLCQIEALTQSLEDSTGFNPGSYKLVISPNIKVAGQISGQKMQSTFNPGLTLLYDHINFHIVDEDETNPLSPNASSMLQEERTEPNTISLLGLKLQVQGLRLFSILGLGLSIFGMVLLGLKIRELTRSDQGAFIRMKYESILVDIKNTELTAALNVIDVTSIDDLAKLAEKYNAMILHEAKGNNHIYSVQGEGTAYRFVMTLEPGAPNIPDEKANDWKGKS